MSSHLWTAEEYAERRSELPDGGRWSELLAGRPVQFVAPDEEHGRAVMNLSRRLSAHIQEHLERGGYACFDLGLILSRQPDTVHCPTLSYFEGGELFAESERIVTESVPRLVIDVASTHDRRRMLRQRVERFLAHGVETVWTIDPVQLQVIVLAGGHSQVLQTGDMLTGADELLAGFTLKVEELFLEPRW